LPNLQLTKEIRMRLHANAALGLAGRRRLVGLIEQGHSLRAAAAALGVSPATAHRWWHRWARAGAPSARAAPAWPIARAPPIASPAA
jgi:transposase-like protein